MFAQYTFILSSAKVLANKLHRHAIDQRSERWLVHVLKKKFVECCSILNYSYESVIDLSIYNSFKLIFKFLIDFESQVYETRIRFAISN